MSENYDEKTFVEFYFYFCDNGLIMLNALEVITLMQLKIDQIVTTCRPVGVVFNTMDIMRKFSRKSYLGEYEIKEGYPINPKGRTGLRGRGILRRWGPNPIYKVVLTRYAI